MRKFTLSEEEVLGQSSKLNKLFSLFPTRKEKLERMYNILGDRVLLSPASTKPIIHNAFPGGYLDHVIRVTMFATATAVESRASCAT